MTQKEGYQTNKRSFRNVLLTALGAAAVVSGAYGAKIGINKLQQTFSEPDKIEQVAKPQYQAVVKLASISNTGAGYQLEAMLSPHEQTQSGAYELFNCTPGCELTLYASPSGMKSSEVKQVDALSRVDLATLSAVSSVYATIVTNGEKNEHGAYKAQVIDITSVDNDSHLKTTPHATPRYKAEKLEDQLTSNHTTLSDDAVDSLTAPFLRRMNDTQNSNYHSAAPMPNGYHTQPNVNSVQFADLEQDAQDSLEQTVEQVDGTNPTPQQTTPTLETRMNTQQPDEIIGTVRNTAEFTGVLIGGARYGIKAELTLDARTNPGLKTNKDGYVTLELNKDTKITTKSEALLYSFFGKHNDTGCIRSTCGRYTVSGDVSLTKLQGDRYLVTQIFITNNEMKAPVDDMKGIFTDLHSYQGWQTKQVHDVMKQMQPTSPPTQQPTIQTPQPQPQLQPKTVKPVVREAKHVVRTSAHVTTKRKSKKARRYVQTSKKRVKPTCADASSNQQAYAYELF